MRRLKDLIAAEIAERISKYPSRDSRVENTVCENYGHSFRDGICERCGAVDGHA